MTENNRHANTLTRGRLGLQHRGLWMCSAASGQEEMGPHPPSPRCPSTAALLATQLALLFFLHTHATEPGTVLVPVSETAPGPRGWTHLTGSSSCASCSVRKPCRQQLVLSELSLLYFAFSGHLIALPRLWLYVNEAGPQATCTVA